MTAWLPTPETLVLANVAPCVCADCCSPATTWEINDEATGPLAKSMTTTWVPVPAEYVQTIPVLPVGTSPAGCDIGAATFTPRPELTVSSVGQVRLVSPAAGVGVAAAGGVAVGGTAAAVAADLEVDVDVDAGVKLPHATSVAERTTGAIRARRTGVCMSLASSIAGSASPSAPVDARPIAGRSQNRPGGCCSGAPAIWPVAVESDDVNHWFGEYLDAFAACGRGESETASLLEYYRVPLLITTGDGFYARP